MRGSDQSAKPYWQMNKEELAAATKEFDQEIPNDTFHPLGPEKRSIWNLLQRGEPLAPPNTVSKAPEIRIRSQADIRPIRTKVRKAALGCLKRLKKMVGLDPLELLAHFKFEAGGHNPLDPRAEMNLVEQINQSATLLVACAAVEHLSRKHPSQDGYVISRPTASGYDLWAIDASVAAEVFAATAPGSNRKLSKNLAAVLKNKSPFQLDPPQHRYVFFVTRSLKGLPKSLEVAKPDAALGGDVWHLVSHGRRSVTVVRLPEKTVFGLNSWSIGANP